MRTWRIFVDIIEHVYADNDGDGISVVDYTFDEALLNDLAHFMEKVFLLKKA